MSVKDVTQWLILGTMLLGAGMWLGRLQQTVNDLGAREHYEHGSYTLPQ